MTESGHPLELRIQQLQADLQYARAIAEQERRRAQRAEESAKRAWRLVCWAGARRMGAD
jgi:hypothetical protein